MLLCGSALSFMGGLLAGSAPMRGRASLELIVPTLDYRLAAEFWDISDPLLALKVHAITGGTPAYRREFVRDDTPAGAADFDGWVLRTVLSPASPLFREARYLLADEPDLRDIGLYHSVLGDGMKISWGWEREGAGMRSGRLLEMLLLLQARGQVTAAELAERLEVSPRTVYRDAEALSSAGVPIYTERGRAGGIRLLPGYRTDVTGLTQDEARALFVLTTGGAHEDLGLGNAARSAVLKVMRAVPEPFRPAATATSQRILVDPAGWMRGSEPAGHLGVLQAAVFSGRRLRLGYRSSGRREPAERVVDPYGLVCKSGIWYLVADQHGEPRLFRVSRVVSAEADEAPARRRDGVELAGLWETLRRQVEERPAEVAVVARVRRDWLDMFRRICASHLDGQAEDDGEDPEWAVVRLPFGAVPAARTLLSFGGDVEVVSPPEVRADLAAVAAATVERYART